MANKILTWKGQDIRISFDNLINFIDVCDCLGGDYRSLLIDDYTISAIGSCATFIGVVERDAVDCPSKEELAAVLRDDTEGSIWVHPIVALEVAIKQEIDTGKPRFFGRFVEFLSDLVAQEYPRKPRDAYKTYEEYEICYARPWCNYADKFKKKPKEITPKKLRKEHQIRDYLARELDGVIEVKTPVGFIDVLTDSEIIEVKTWKEWKHGLGQLLAYNVYFPTKQPILHLFGKIDKQYAEQVVYTCKELNVLVRYSYQD